MVARLNQTPHTKQEVPGLKPVKMKPFKYNFFFYKKRKEIYKFFKMRPNHKSLPIFFKLDNCQHIFHALCCFKNKYLLDWRLELL